MHGPPGTGKTHFLSLSVLNLLAAAFKAARRDGAVVAPFRVLVTAFTHTAIDGLLERMRELFGVAQTLEHDADGAWRDLLLNPDAPGGINIVKFDKKTSMGPLLRNATAPFVIAGATTWAIHHHFFGKPPQFDMLLIDEGSQVWYWLQRGNCTYKNFFL